MPENDPTDPFAELYGRLPDPRSGATDATARGDATAGGPGPEAPPPSRRAAREARRAQTGETPQTPETQSGVAPTPPTAPVPAPRAAAQTTPIGAPAEERQPEPAEERRPEPVAAWQPTPRRQPEPGPQRQTATVGVATAAAGDRGVASGSLDDLFSGRAHSDDVQWAAPPKRRRRVAGWIALAVVLVIIGGLVGGGFALWNTYGDRVREFLGTGEPTDYAEGMATGEARVTIVSGDTGESVSPKLFEAGITKQSDSLYKYMVQNGVAFTFQPGVYKLQQQMSSPAVLTALRDPASRLNHTVQLREGLTLNQSLDAMSEQLTIPRADFEAAVADPSQYGVPASTLEGWIFPATYDFDDGVTATQVIQKMVQRTVQSLDQAGVPEADRERILIIASIIEREARNSDDFYKVSRVIENRLQPDNDETHGLLQMDSTAQYGVGEIGAGSSSSSENALTNDNPWNTYIHPGLPIGPIANAGDLAIDAAMHPVDGTWYYFTTVNLDTGETVFSTTYADQEKAVQQFRDWCRANPNSGC
ncbi:endolytic transglycosylase MltG [Microbacterium sp. SLBN-111]|uniref:endolytic transglycosylase MltG n=1 Tax=Microbacterium sp. SLBN-111 TaxID=3377733 RepID=UPI003C730115